MPKGKLKRRIVRLLLTGTGLLGPFAFFMASIGEAAQPELSEQASPSISESLAGETEKTGSQQMPGWWREHVTLNGDLRAALAVNGRGNRDGTGQTNILPVARIRGGFAMSLTPWLDATARLATFFDKEVEGVGFRLRHRRDIQPGDLTFDSVFLTLRPHELVTMKIGRLQTEDPPFELDSVVKDSLSRHDSSGLDVSWTDGIHVIVGKASSLKLHLIGQVNPEEGPTNGVGTRGPLEFRDGGTRVTYYAALEPPPVKPFTQLVADVTVIPQALRPAGLGRDSKEDVVAFTMRVAADFALAQGSRPLTVHPFTEFGVMLSTPRESVLKVSSSNRRANHFAFVAGFDLKHLGPGALGFQFGWAQAGYLISPDYPNNAWSSEARYKLSVTKNAVFEIRYRHRQDIDRLIDALDGRTDDNILARVTVKF